MDIVFDESSHTQIVERIFAIGVQYFLLTRGYFETQIKICSSIHTQRAHLNRDIFIPLIHGLKEFIGNSCFYTSPYES
jgi:hypothetical protein